MIVRKAAESDIDAVSDIYLQINDAEEKGTLTTGWERNVYPVRDTALEAFKNGELFVGEDNGIITGSAIINRKQVDVYAGAGWKYEAPDDEVMVLHTLSVSPLMNGKGYGKEFVKFYEQYALSEGCPYLRMDTNERNIRARKIYHSLGYDEIGRASCCFNGIQGVILVLLEKKL